MADQRELSRQDDDLVDALLPVRLRDGDPPISDRVRFDHSKGQWHVWDGMRWAPDKTDLVYDMVRAAAGVLIVGSSGEKQKIFLTLLNRSKKESILKSMASRRGIALTGEEWDPDPTLIAFTNGVLDLKTLEFERAPSPTLMLSRSTNQPYDPEAKAPRFVKFLEEVMGGDADLFSYLAHVLGYAMFGWQREQKFWMWVGQGQNGKGTLAKVVTHALGDYGGTPSAELYMKTRFGAARSDAARPDLLRLQGVRFTWMSEPSGGQFHEEMLKAHTGDDPIQARDLYGNAASFKTFRPSHTIIFLTNTPPRTEDVGASMQRRTRVIKFEQDFRGERENKNLEVELKAEAVGILTLLAAFASNWHDTGLSEPRQVTAWSNEYIEANDPLTGFLDDVCVVERGAKVSAALVWAAYQDWCARNDVEGESRTAFGSALGRRFPKTRYEAGYTYKGLRVKNAGELADA